MPEMEPDGPGSLAFGEAFGPATHSMPGTPALRSGHIQRSSGVKRKVKSVPTHAVELKQHHRSRSRHRVARRKHDLAHREADVRVRNDGAVRANLDLRCLAVHLDRDRVALDVGLDGEVRQQLDGQQPRFESAVLLADKNAALAGNGEGLFSSLRERESPGRCCQRQSPGSM